MIHGPRFLDPFKVLEQNPNCDNAAVLATQASTAFQAAKSFCPANSPFFHEALKSSNLSSYVKSKISTRLDKAVRDGEELTDDTKKSIDLLNILKLVL